MNKTRNLGVLLLGLFIFSSFAAHADTYKSLSEALAAPEKVTRLNLGDIVDESAEPTEADAPEPEISSDIALKHLPSEIGSLIHLKELQITGLEALEDLPAEIGNLKELESIVIDNGNGYRMNISVPESIGNLTQLKTLRLYGALDARAFDEGMSEEENAVNENAELAKVKKLPQGLGKLQNLEILDLGRNGLSELPPQVASLSNLTILSLNYNTIGELPEFVGNLKKLKYLELSENGGTKLPDSLKNLKGLNISIGDPSLKLKDQQNLRERFPDAIFDFSCEYEDEDETTYDEPTSTD